MKKVYEYNNSSNEFSMVILDEESFELGNLCDSHIENGEYVGCEEAACYNLENEDSSFLNDLFKYLEIDISNFTLSYSDDFEEIFEEFLLDNGLDFSLKDKAISWIYENEEHSEGKYFSYFDGSSNVRKTLILSSDSLSEDLCEIDDELNEKILKSFEKYDTYIYNDASKSEEIDGFEFSNSRWNYDFGIAWVKIL